MDALAFCIVRRKVSWILDADIGGFFDTVSHDHLDRFLNHRIGDRRMLRLLGKWLDAGVAEDGRMMPTERGTPQGAVVSPLLSNIYLHYVFDLWANQWRHRHAQGEMSIVRYADDIVVGFQYRSDATRFQADMRAKLKDIKQALQHRWHLAVAEQGAWLGQVVGGYFAYHAVPTNARSLRSFLHHVKVLWKSALHRRSQKDRTTWARMDRLAATWLPKPRIRHPWPLDRFAVKHSR